MYVKFLQSPHCIKNTLTVSCTLLCESGDRVKFDQSSFSADLHAVMLRHHCSEYVPGCAGARWFTSIFRNMIRVGCIAMSQAERFICYITEMPHS